VISTGVINLIATSASVPLVEKFGRRPLILYPLVIITFIMIVICVCIQFNMSRFRMLIMNFFKINILALFPLILMLCFIFIFAIGLGPIPYIYPNEVFTIDLRPAALSISMFASWICNTCESFSF